MHGTFQLNETTQKENPGPPGSGLGIQPTTSSPPPPKKKKFLKIPNRFWWVGLWGLEGLKKRAQTI